MQSKSWEQIALGLSWKMEPTKPGESFRNLRRSINVPVPGPQSLHHLLTAEVRISFGPFGSSEGGMREAFSSQADHSGGEGSKTDEGA